MCDYRYDDRPHRHPTSHAIVECVWCGGDVLRWKAVACDGRRGCDAVMCEACANEHGGLCEWCEEAKAEGAL